MTAFAHPISRRNRLVVLAFPMIAGMWLAPSSLAAPPDQQRDVTADDGSTFSVSYHLPPKAEGITSSFKIVPGSATGPAEGASRFVYHEVLITNSNGVVLQAGDAEGSVGRNHPLVTISYQGVQNPDDTINRTGFYLPAKPEK